MNNLNHLAANRKAYKEFARRVAWIFVAGLVVVGAFVVGAVFTPPDVLSQFLLAVPLWLLYEIGIIIAGFISRISVITLRP